MSRSVKSIATALVLFVAGCATETREVRATPPPMPKPPAAKAPRDVPPSNASNLDPCAMRLHDLAGALFLYYFTYQKLPATLDEVNTFPGAEATVPLVCPTSNRPYAYTPDGILLAEQGGRVIVYDPTPAHYNGQRWAIRIDEPRDDKPMVAKVVVLPESFFLLRPPTR